MEDNFHPVFPLGKQELTLIKGGSAINRAKYPPLSYTLLYTLLLLANGAGLVSQPAGHNLSL